MAVMSGLSIAGGVAAGMIGSNRKKEKLNEGIFQFINATLPPLLIALPEIEVQQNGQRSLSQGQLPVDRDGRHGKEQHNGEIKF